MRFSRVRAAMRLCRMTLHLLWGVVLVGTVFRWSTQAQRHEHIAKWSGRMLAHLGMTVESQGHPRPGGTLLVANHVSFLDIAVIHALCPRARFVSKAEVRRWPVVGGLAAAVGTLFIERSSRRDAMRVNHQMAQAMSAGDVVAVFPEGTTGTGPTVLPFHANLLQSAIVTSTPVQPLCLRYSQGGAPFSPAIEFVGDTTLLAALWTVACAQDMRVHVDWLAPRGSAHQERRALTELVRADIDGVLAPYRDLASKG